MDCTRPLSAAIGCYFFIYTVSQKTPPFLLSHKICFYLKFEISLDYSSAKTEKFKEFTI